MQTNIDHLRAFAAEHRISHIAIGPYNPIVVDIAAQHSERFELMYRNNTFAIYRFVAHPDSLAGIPPPDQP